MTSMKVSGAVLVATLAAMAAPGFAAAANLSATPGIEIHGNSIVQIPAMPGRPDARVQLSGEVLLTDLDLNRTQDVATLRQRVAETATQVCATLNQEYRGMLVGGDDSTECVRNAVDGAQNQINRAVAATLAQRRAG